MDIIYTENEISEIAKKVIENTKSKVLLFHAPMGAGKTTLIKAIVKHLGVANAGNSPTFGIVNEYESKEGQLLAYHFDFYRINDEMEALDMGFEDYLNQDVWIFIEWPEKIKSFLPENSTNVFIEVVDMQTRQIKIS